MAPFALAAAAPNQQSYTASLNREFWRPPMDDVGAAVFHLLQIPPAPPPSSNRTRRRTSTPTRTTHGQRP